MKPVLNYKVKNAQFEVYNEVPSFTFLEVEQKRLAAGSVVGEEVAGGHPPKEQRRRTLSRSRRRQYPRMDRE